MDETNLIRQIITDESILSFARRVHCFGNDTVAPMVRNDSDGRTSL